MLLASSLEREVSIDGDGGGGVRDGEGGYVTSDNKEGQHTSMCCDTRAHTRTPACPNVHLRPIYG